MPIAATLAPSPIRQIVHRSRGRSHGFVTRLMSPGDLGRILKPFAHPRSGLATLTYVAEGSVSYEDTNGATGIPRVGGVLWMRAGKGVWHSGRAGARAPWFSALDRAAAAFGARSTMAALDVTSLRMAKMAAMKLLESTSLLLLVAGIVLSLVVSLELMP